eukprot:CAMPEP_0115835360 /NCGR_PEP_ID=MMETSP0287-20121206/4154_1 /TAXON_ID=412157 /ORGANISM="Chrysochromulina rotalis, Strain UIO044" /LENGTH=157 /DNA_ID=CAMNT_0003288815 /DNA_START=335 /DNA_END=810 /DNA_ORIENTATION=+
MTAFFGFRPAELTWRSSSCVGRGWPMSLRAFDLPRPAHGVDGLKHLLRNRPDAGILGLAVPLWQAEASAMPEVAGGHALNAGLPHLIAITRSAGVTVRICACVELSGTSSLLPGHLNGICDMKVSTFGFSKPPASPLALSASRFSFILFARSICALA